MVETYGLTHISLAVADPQRSLEFYTAVFGVKEYYRDDEQIQAQGYYEVITGGDTRSVGGVTFTRSWTLLGPAGPRC